MTVISTIIIETGQTIPNALSDLYWDRISENNQYNYQLELRQKGLVIKPLDNSSVSFVESNKGLVIESAISEIMNIVGFVKGQLKTIVIDIKKRF